MRTVPIPGSENVAAVGYNLYTRVCEVTFHPSKKEQEDGKTVGRKYSYPNVDQSDVLQLMFCKSPGGYMQSTFKQKYKGVEVETVRSGQ